MGAYEHVGVAGPEFLVGDVTTTDGVVDVADLIALLAAWGPCPGCCPADLDLSGTVDFEDLLIVLAH